MKKAEKIFNDTRRECRKHIEDWGYEMNVDGNSIGFNGLITEDVICVRTINDVQTILNKARDTIKLDIKLGITNLKKEQSKIQVLNMVQSTLDNQRKSL